MKKMLEKIKTSLAVLFGRIFGKDLPLEHFVFLCVAIAGIFMAVTGLVGNSSLGLGPLTLLVPALFIAADVLCIIYSIKTKRWHGAAFVAVGSAIFVLFPFLWFTTGGATGSTMPLMVTSGLCVIIIFKGKLRAGMLAADALMCVAFIALEYFYPDIFIPYPDRYSWYVDLTIGLLLSFAVNGALASIVMARYEKARSEEAALARKLAHISLTDPLTGISNRRFLAASIDEEMRLAYDNGTQLALCILDIDHFKKINDTWGHVYGDEVLIAIGRIMTDCLTSGEIFGRYGGEEFLVLLPGMTPQAALPAVRELCGRVKAHPWKHGGPVTLSAGLGCYTKGITYSNLIEKADKNLYAAKNGGRDRIVCDPAEACPPGRAQA